MSKFSELMKQPLPSARNNTFTEGTSYYEGCSEGCSEGSCGNLLDLPNSELVGAPTEPPVCPPGGCDDTTIPSPDDTVDTTPLTPEQSQKVDDTINAVATPILIGNELNDEQCREFVESMDSDIAVNEGFLTEKTIIKFDKNAKRAQLYEVAVAAVAREKKDPLYKKLQTVYKMERIIKAKLRKKYHSQAQQKVKEYLARAKKSKSGVLSRIANKITGK